MVIWSETAKAVLRINLLVPAGLLRDSVLPGQAQYCSNGNGRPGIVK